MFRAGGLGFRAQGLKVEGLEAKGLGAPGCFRNLAA